MDDLKKGLWNLFNSEGNDLTKHSKKGSEIKEGVKTLQLYVVNNKMRLLDKLKEILENLSVNPDQEGIVDSDYKNLIDFWPRRFSYEFIENSLSDKELMRGYNRVENQYKEACVDLIKLQTLLKNIIDNKTYMLTIDQLAILGI